MKNLKSYIYDIDKNKQWRYDYVNPNPRIADLTIGICGFGKIGTRVAQKAKALGMKVIATDPFTNNKLEDVELVTKEELFANADIITNNMNLNETNHSYFNYDAFKLMEKKPYLIMQICIIFYRLFKSTYAHYCFVIRNMSTECSKCFTETLAV